MSTPHVSPTSRTSLVNVDPCTLLTDEGKARLGLNGVVGGQTIVGSDRLCQWRLSTPQGVYFFSISIDGDQGLKDLPEYFEKMPSLGKHEAMRPSSQSGAFSCGVALGVTETSHVNADVITTGDPEKQCDLAMELAKLVEPFLP